VRKIAKTTLIGLAVLCFVGLFATSPMAQMYDTGDEQPAQSGPSPHMVCGPPPPYMMYGPYPYRLIMGPFGYYRSVMDDPRRGIQFDDISGGR